MIVGSAIFGVGWGLCGICPAPLLATIPVSNIKVAFYWGISCVIGIKTIEFLQFVFGKLFKSHK